MNEADAFPGSIWKNFENCHHGTAASDLMVLSSVDWFHNSPKNLTFIFLPRADGNGFGGDHRGGRVQLTLEECSDLIKVGSLEKCLHRIASCTNPPIGSDGLTLGQVLYLESFLEDSFYESICHERSLESWKKIAGDQQFYERCAQAVARHVSKECDKKTIEMNLGAYDNGWNAGRKTALKEVRDILLKSHGRSGDWILSKMEKHTRCEEGQ